MRGSLFARLVPRLIPTALKAFAVPMKLTYSTLRLSANLYDPSPIGSSRGALRLSLRSYRNSSLRPYRSSHERPRTSAHPIGPPVEHLVREPRLIRRGP